VLPDPESLALAVATAVVAYARRATRRSGRFALGLAGGDTPRRAYELLAEPPLADLMPWGATHVFWGDERCVDPSDARSNEQMAQDALLRRVPIPPGQVHPMRCSGTEERGDVARRGAGEYEGLLRSFFDGAGRPGEPGAGLDLCLLGLGTNGHTASLFPGSEVLSERERWVAASYEDAETAAVTSRTGERLWRVTLTVPFINRAAAVLFVVSGRAKAWVTREAVHGRADPDRLPAVLIRPAAGRLLWFLDDEAASQLERRHGRASTCGSEEQKAEPPTAASDAPGFDSFDDLPGCELGPSR
jgi:6-phosphogluconolactonase